MCLNAKGKVAGANTPEQNKTGIDDNINDLMSETAKKKVLVAVEVHGLHKGIGKSSRPTVHFV